MRFTIVVSLLFAGLTLLSGEESNFLRGWVELTLFGTRITSCLRCSGSVFR